MESKQLNKKITRKKALALIWRLENLLDTWKKEIAYCEKEIQEIKKNYFYKTKL